METSYTKRSTRIIIWIITAVMAIGSVGAYFIIILENNNSKNGQSTETQDLPAEQKKVDPTAFKVEGKVAELQKTDIKEGAGPEVKLGDTIRVHYKLTHAQDGTLYESSYDTGEPATFKLQEGQLIEGWTKGIPGMKEGGKRRLVIPSALAYKESGGQAIGPNTDLVFEIELLAVNPPTASENDQ